MARVTLDDISTLTGLSTATVSRVINNKGHVRPETRRMVLEAMQRLGRGIPVDLLVGLVVPDVANPFFAQLGFGFEREFESRGVHVLMSSSDNRSDREMALIQHFKALGARGLIYIAAGSERDAVLAVVADGRMPVVVFDRNIGARNVDFVGVDSREGTFRAIDYLAAVGHLRIGHLKGLEDTWTAQERYQAYRDAMTKNRLEIEPRWIFEGSYDGPSGRRCAERLIRLPISSRPTAMLVGNDIMAIALMQRLQEEGWTLPRDMSVIGFDGIAWSQWVYPSLTTIAQPTEILIREAARLLMRRIEDMDAPGRVERPADTVELAPSLVVRTSVTNPIASA